MNDHIYRIVGIDNWGPAGQLECVGHDVEDCDLQTWWGEHKTDMLDIEGLDIAIPVVRRDLLGEDGPTIGLADRGQSPLAEAARLLLAANTSDWEDCDVCAVLETECPYHQGRRDEHNDLLKPGVLLTLPAPVAEPVRPDDKVLRDEAGQAHPVRSVISIEAEYVGELRRIVALAAHLSNGRAVSLQSFGSAEGAYERASAVRDRIIREIYDSPKRIVCAHEDDPMSEA